jgi:hypothetical protein
MKDGNWRGRWRWEERMGYIPEDSGYGYFENGYNPELYPYRPNKYNSPDQKIYDIERIDYHSQQNADRLVMD